MGTVSTLLDQFPHEADSERDHQAEFSLMLRHSQSREGVEEALPGRSPGAKASPSHRSTLATATTTSGLSPALATELAAKPRLQDLLR